jgi:hypothetical protein
MLASIGPDLLGFRFNGFCVTVGFGDWLAAHVEKVTCWELAGLELSGGL